VGPWPARWGERAGQDPPSPAGGAGSGGAGAGLVDSRLGIRSAVPGETFSDFWGRPRKCPVRPPRGLATRIPSSGPLSARTPRSSAASTPLDTLGSGYRRARRSGAVGIIRGFKNFLMRATSWSSPLVWSWRRLQHADPRVHDERDQPSHLACIGRDLVRSGVAARSPGQQDHLPQHRHVHLGDHLLPRLHCRRVVRGRRFLQVHTEAARGRRLRESRAGGDLPGLPLRGPAARGHQVQVLRNRPAGLVERGRRRISSI
jgi:hypothetical protein